MGRKQGRVVLLVSTAAVTNYHQLSGPEQPRYRSGGPGGQHRSHSTNTKVVGKGAPCSGLQGEARPLPPAAPGHIP